MDKAEVEAKKADRELTEDMNKARQKVRGAINEHENQK